jgi:hypothetical protein
LEHEEGEGLPFCICVWVVYGDAYALFNWSCHFDVVLEKLSYVQLQNMAALPNKQCKHPAGEQPHGGALTEG